VVQTIEFSVQHQRQDHFQIRFRPRYANRYICVTPKTSVGSMVSLLVATGGIKPHVGNPFQKPLEAEAQSPFTSYQSPFTS